MNVPKVKNPFYNAYEVSIFAYITHILLSIMKGPLFLALNLLHLIHYFVSQILYIPILKRFLLRLSAIILGFIMNILSGYIFIPIRSRNIKKEKNEIEKDKINDFDSNEITAGDIIISNYPSYLDLIYLQYKFTPVFFIPIDSNHVEIKSFYQILLESILLNSTHNTRKRSDNDNDKKVLENDLAIELAKNAMHCPIILLPEIIKTNCTSIIKFHDFKANFEKTRIFILGLKHDLESRYTEPNYVSGSFIKHFVLTFGVLTNSLELNFCNERDMPNFQSDIDAMRKCREIVSELSGLPLYNEDVKNKKTHED